MNALTTQFKPPSKTMKDLETREDIAILVEKFYEKVFVDETIGHIFTDFMNVRPETHFPIMINFWETVLFAKNAYHGNVIMKHVNIHRDFPLKGHHFDRWIELLFETLDENFKGEITELAKIRAKSMAMVLQVKIKFYQDI
jgi:hemoglobin